jgi:tetratricopeptide (TPR) repeat protein
MPRLLLLVFTFFLPGLVLGNSIQQLEAKLQLKKYASAAQTGMVLLNHQPDNLNIKFLTALALQNNKQPLIAKKYYQQIIESNPGLPEPRNNLAMIYLQQGQHDQAVDLLISALKTDPAYATAWMNLSNLYKGLASEAYRRALSEEKDVSSVVHKIKLTALTNLDSLPASSIGVKPVIEKPLQTAAVEKNIAPVLEQKPVTKAPLQLEKPPVTEKPLSNEELIKIVQNWAQAWSKKDIKTYLDAYTSYFKGRKASHKEWVEIRKNRIKRPGNISVKISNITIKSSTPDQAIVDFHQSYSSATYSDKVVKRVHLTKTGKNWKISRENTLAVL